MRDRDVGERSSNQREQYGETIRVALGLALLIYAVVAVSALAALGPSALAASQAPLAASVRAGSLEWLLPAVRIGATVASLGVLLSLLAGVSRTAFSMARNHDFPLASQPYTPDSEPLIERSSPRRHS